MAAIVFPVLFLGAGLGAALYFLNSGPVLGSGDASSAADFVATPVPENRPAPSFSVPSLDGLHAVTSAALARRVVVINLWASWCAPCREEAPDLRRLWLAYRAKGIGFIGIDHADTRTGGRTFRRSFGLGYPMGFDPEGKVASDFGAIGLPTTYVIDRGRIVYRLLGRVRYDVMAKILDGLVATKG